MENLNLETYGVEEISENQLTEINGGGLPGDNIFEAIAWLIDNYPQPVGQKLGPPLQKMELSYR